MSSVIHSLINVFLIDVLHKILRRFPLKSKSVQITTFVWNGAYSLVSEQSRKLCTDYFIPSVL